MNQNYFSSFPTTESSYLFQSPFQPCYENGLIQAQCTNFLPKHTVNHKLDASNVQHPIIDKKVVKSSRVSLAKITYDEQQQSIKNSPAYFLGLFIDSEIIEWFMAAADMNGKFLKNFTTVKEEEMRCFIAILYLSGYVQVPRRRMFWERSPDTHCALVSNALQRDRFEAIFTALHTNESNFDKLKPLISKLNNKFLQQTPVDDQHSFAEYHLSTKNKIWCGCLQSGYCVNFITDNSPSSSVILNYVSVLRHKLTSLTYENVYSDVYLSTELGKLNVQGIGVTRDRNTCALNPSLGGFDRLESNLNLYRISMKARKPYSMLLTFCLDLALNNAWQLYRNVTGDKKLASLEFRRSVVVYYLEHYAKAIVGRKGGRPTKIKSRKRLRHSEARYDGIRHYVVPQGKQTRCAKCKAKTTTRCQKCDVGVHVKCFVEFHVLKET